MAMVWADAGRAVASRQTAVARTAVASRRAPVVRRLMSDRPWASPSVCSLSHSGSRRTKIEVGIQPPLRIASVEYQPALVIHPLGLAVDRERIARPDDHIRRFARLERPRGAVDAE